MVARAERTMVERVEQNRFVGREFLLWLWFESVVFETTLSGCSLWLETRLSLAFEKDETRVSTGAPSVAPEAREALRQGKLPREARLHLVRGEDEYTWLLKADALWFSALKLPAELDAKKDEAHEVLYERMRLVEELEETFSALWSEFLSLRLSSAWQDVVVPELRRFAREESIDADAYLAAKRSVAPPAPRDS